MIRGRTVSAMLAATYIACREIGVGKTLKDIAEGSNVKPKTLSQCYRTLLTELDIKTPMLDPMRCVAKVASRMQLNEMTSRQAMGIMHNAMKSEAAGKNPMGLAAAVLYISYHNNNIKNNALRKSNDSEDKRTQTSFAQASGITDVTLRNTVRSLKNQLLLLN